MQSHFAVVFPGQGSQKVGMCSALAEQHPIVRTLFDEASAVLKYDLWNIVSNDPESKLNQTLYTQPAMLVADV
ncbi:MAG: acyltransferase domain-containing protein, partial [Gammaproteobacteria bacterium]|nr:acyltransferase domain-containing protein [Gammaproteobacteria bacterium]